MKARCCFLWCLLTGLFSFGVWAVAGPLPAVRPLHFSVTYHQAGGLKAVEETLYLAEKGSYYSRTFQDITNKLELGFSPQDLDKLFFDLKRNQFDRIVTAPFLGMDKPFTSIDVRWGMENVQVSTLGKAVTEKWSKSWTALLGLIQGIKDKHLTAKRLAFGLELTDSLVGHRVSVAIDNDNLFYRIVDKPLSIEKAFLPGQYYLSVKVWQVGDAAVATNPANDPLLLAQKKAVINVTKTGRVSLAREGAEIAVKEIERNTKQP